MYTCLLPLLVFVSCFRAVTGSGDCLSSPNRVQCNTEVAERPGLPPLMDLIIYRRRNSLFGDVYYIGCQ